MRKHWFLFLWALSISACSNRIPFAEGQALNRPVGISVTAISGNRFSLSYTVQNTEAVFDGYNVYVHLADFSEGEAGSSVPPLILSGGEPTLKHTASEFNTQKTVELSYTSDNVTKFEAGTDYTFKMAAHGRNGERSLLSEGVTARALP